MRINNLINRFGRETLVYRKLGNDEKDPYKRGKFELKHTLQAIVDEDTQGGQGGFNQGRVTDMRDATLYCGVIDIRVGDKVVQRDKEYRVLKPSNPYNADDHMECSLEYWG